ncbi:MAG TPA: hypothetical protein VMS64_36975 [Candidatus Methylomirabilis sp.]|nr:hypothetical protein [Candidatus Methylomirabilis sp.]
MARTGGIYPQVEPGVTALMRGRVIGFPAEGRVADALRAAQGAGAEVVVLGARRAVRRRELERGVRWGLGDLSASDLAWHDVPAVPATAREVVARRLLIEGAPMLLVRRGRQVLGVIDADLVEIARPMTSLAHELDHVDARDGEARLWLLRVAGKMGEGLGTPVFAVGGFVRDLLLGRVAPDVDLLVEGDGVAFARQLREEIGGEVVVHAAFGTASIEGASGPAGARLGRIDITSARRERYEVPGALPVVSRATVEEDLRRRDFSVNALALALSPSSFGRLLDPLGGRRDLARRRLRLLHPVSFVEDPTRIFRAARYAARLGFRLDIAGIRAIRLALRVAAYPALSGQRLRAEVELMVAEPQGWRGLASLLRWKALRLWDADYEESRRGVGRIRAGARLRRWAKRSGIELDASEVMVIALLVDQHPAVVSRCLERLAFRGEPARRLQEAATATALARRLDRERLPGPSAIADALGRCSIQALAGAWLHGGRRARRRVEWYLRTGRHVRPMLSGDDVVALGVPQGPAVGECLAALRRLRLDRIVKTRGHERLFVEAWLRKHGRRVARRPAPPERRVRFGRMYESATSAAHATRKAERERRP